MTIALFSLTAVMNTLIFPEINPAGSAPPGLMTPEMELHDRHREESCSTIPKYECNTKTLNMSQTDAFLSSQETAAELIALEVYPASGCLITEISIIPGNESMFTVYSLTGQIRLKIRIVSSGRFVFNIDLKKGMYVATLVSGKSWSSKKISID